MRFLILLLILGSCNTTQTNIDLNDLNGYWEIKKVEMADGTVKNFNVSTTVDYIELSGNKGIRKKVAPKLDGTFRTSKQIENFTIEDSANITLIKYTTPFNNWTESLLEVHDSVLSILTREKNVYTYKRYKPLIIIDTIKNGQEKE